MHWTKLNKQEDFIQGYWNRGKRAELSLSSTPLKHRIGKSVYATCVCYWLYPKILQARLQQHMNYELPDVQAGFRKGRGTRDQVANIQWIIEKARVPEEHLLLLY